MNNNDHSACNHSWLPLEFQAGRKSYADEAGETGYLDWTCSIVSADRLRVTKFWCSRCGEICKVPLTKPDRRPL